MGCTISTGHDRDEDRAKEIQQPPPQRQRQDTPFFSGDPSSAAPPPPAAAHTPSSPSSPSSDTTISTTDSSSPKDDKEHTPTQHADVLNQACEDRVNPIHEPRTATGGIFTGRTSQNPNPKLQQRNPDPNDLTGVKIECESDPGGGHESENNIRVTKAPSLGPKKWHSCSPLTNKRSHSTNIPVIFDHDDIASILSSSCDLRSFHANPVYHPAHGGGLRSTLEPGFVTPCMGTGGRGSRTRCDVIPSCSKPIRSGASFPFSGTFPSSEDYFPQMSPRRPSSGSTKRVYDDVYRHRLTSGCDGTNVHKKMSDVLCSGLPHMFQSASTKGNEEEEESSDEGDMVVESDVEKASHMLNSKRSISSHLIDLCDAHPPRRNSQHMFRDRNQTLIVFDWDDTLFPTHWTKLQRRACRKASRNQATSDPFCPDIRQEYDRFAEKVQSLLERALELAHVVIITLSRDPWVEISCNNFLQPIGDWLLAHEIEIIYAQNVGIWPGRSFYANEREYWTAVKQKAITDETNAFYSRYEGQSWKNLISIGDSVFERDATLISLQKYSKETGLKGNGLCCFHGVDRNNHYRRIRAKTVKMMEDPLISDLSIEIELLTNWLPNIIHHDGGFNLDLKSDKLQEELNLLFRRDNCCTRRRQKSETSLTTTDGDVSDRRHSSSSNISVISV